MANKVIEASGLTVSDVVRVLMTRIARDKIIPPGLFQPNAETLAAGNWKDYRDCHVRPDLVLIYRLIDVALIRSWISEDRWPWPSTTPHFRLNRRVAPLAVAVAARWCLSQLGHPLTGDRAL